jgi:hypothetical protein
MGDRYDFEDGTEGGPDGDPQGDERLALAFGRKLVGAHAAHDGERAFDGADDLRHGDRFGRAGQHPAPLAAPLAPHEAGVAQEPEDVIDGRRGEMVELGQVGPAHRMSASVGRALGEPGHHPHRIVDPVGDPHTVRR